MSTQGLPVAPGVARPVVVLIGPPGSGKSTLAHLLASKLRLARRDTDNDVERGSGKTIPELFADEGEPYFRSLEAEVVARALRGFDGVLSLGGGAPLAAVTRAALSAYAASGGAIIFLDVPTDDAVSRLGHTHGRPLLGDDPRGRFEQLMVERRAIYESVATFAVDTGGLTPGDVSDLILEHLAQLKQRELGAPSDLGPPA